MDADQNVSISVHLQQVAIQSVIPQTTNGKRGIVLEIQDLLGIAHLHHPSLDQVEAQRLVLRRDVLSQGVVHVEAIELNILQMQGTVHKNP